ncbi:cytochrome b/b6 domain-containing protein [Hydrogenimonas sp. SS33]|uniref:cytochrome b/b6 domain-containing protein n=1 Tax=Hydrogenimonas leucolamina TaxID=2954236 RepID=UPI00336BC4E2
MKGKFTPLFRLWHWLTVFSVFGLLFTVLLRKSFLNKNAVAEIVRQKLETFGVAIGADQAIAVAKAIRAPMWEWHYIFALFLGIAIALRLWLMATGRAKLPILAVLEAKGVQEKVKAFVHLLLCVTIALMALSGAVYYFHEALGFQKSSVHWLKELHEFLLTPLLLFIALHIGGVVRHELATKEAIVSRMIHGDEVR